MTPCPDCVPCPTCRGSGLDLKASAMNYDRLEPCDDCSGSGIYAQCDSCAPQLDEAEVFGDGPHCL